MNKTTSRILVYAVIILSVMLLATFGTITYHLKVSESNEAVVAETGNQEQVNYNGRYFRERLNLSWDQMQDFKTVHFKFRDEVRLINQELIQKRELMLAEMQKSTPDTIQLNEYSDNIGALHSKLKKETYKYYLGIKQICDEEQVIELNKLFDEFFITDNMKGGQGNGRGLGPRRQHDEIE